MLPLSAEVQQRLEEHARSAPQHEVCGFVYADRYVPLRNRSKEATRFEANPQDVAAALTMYREPLAVFHTHPDGPAEPSDSDLAESYYYNSIIIIGTWGADGSLVLHEFPESGGAGVPPADIPPSI